MSLHAAGAAKLLQSCPTLCDPIDGSPPGFSVLGVLQARILEWVAISFSRKGGLDATMGTMEAAGGIPFEAIRPGGRWVAPLPPHHCSHCPRRPRRRQVVDVWTANLGFHPPCHRRVLKQPPGKWISNARLTHYQALLLDAPRVRFQTP